MAVTLAVRSEPDCRLRPHWPGSSEASFVVHAACVAPGSTSAATAAHAATSDHARRFSRVRSDNCGKSWGRYEPISG